MVCPLIPEQFATAVHCAPLQHIWTHSTLSLSIWEQIMNANMVNQKLSSIDDSSKYIKLEIDYSIYV
jgi:hypothetical protein